MYDKCYFCLDQLPKLKKESTASFFVTFWRSRGTKEPAYITVLNRKSSFRNRQAIVIHSLVQGGPGASSMFGVLKEHGPFLADLDVDGKPFVKENPYTWAGNHSVLYVDNPIGTGFSFTDDPDDFPSFVEETTEVIISYFDQT